MPKEMSAGAIVFRRDARGQPLYLLLHYPSASRSDSDESSDSKRRAKKEYWDFPKGHVEQGETEEQTVRREVKEETGLQDLEFVQGFRETINYMFQAEGKKIYKTVVFYLAKTKTKDVVISFEHVAFKWLPFDSAMKQLKFTNAKKLLKKANNLISNLPLRA